MSPRSAILTDKAPAPIPVLSQAIVHGNTVYCSGQTGADPVTREIVGGTVADRARQCLKNLSAVLEAAGSDMDHVLKVNVYLDDIDNFAQVNEVYGEFFGEPKPARTCVAVKNLPLRTDVEIELTAALKE
ncbi:hypothetical protein CANCADRAFT_123813 [Tortispora caseinolytica NRRL Y-17796]|uniref:Uncharacterized protein n=1 Tax=Tortispora caseinolytica NRRL Y-17796 TaxID=767744 RepID=A0A1E4T9U6_9ASCO|nr:hypothetical protein CANCADRAFT_123813 [Tortispora caseinolytica NRRL Y-17796]